MGGLFNYENKVMQVMMVIGDIIILNILFILCSIPLVTIGAAEAGLYSGIRVLTDKEDDSSCAKAFFKGFTGGFWRITPVWTVLMILFVIASVSLLPLETPDGMWLPAAPVWISVLAVAICGIFMSLVTWFHARFHCTPLQLVRNAGLMFLAHPLRSILITVVNSIPLLIAGYDFYLFMQLTPIIISVGFSVLFLFSFTVMKKPFQDLLKIHNEKKEQEETPEALPEETTEEIPAEPLEK